MAQMRYIKNAVFLFVTVVSDKEGSQKRAQLECLEQVILERPEFTKLNVRTVKFCIGNSEADAVQKCQDEIKACLWPQAFSPHQPLSTIDFTWETNGTDLPDHP